MSRYIVKTMHLEIPKRPIIWNGGSTKQREHATGPQSQITSPTDSNQFRETKHIATQNLIPKHTESQ
jgi:hypothetical protein